MVAREYYWNIYKAEKDERYGWIPKDFVGSVKDAPLQRDILRWAYSNTSSVPLMISKAWVTVGRDGEYGEHERNLGIVKAVKRKSGRAVVFYKAVEYLYEDGYTADITPNGTLVNKR